MVNERWTATTPINQRVRLSEDGWTKKIVISHPEFSLNPQYEHEIRQTLEDPEAILEGWAGEFLAIRLCVIAPKSPKHLCVVYRDENPEGFVITAFFVSRRDKLMRRKVKWKR